MNKIKIILSSLILQVSVVSIYCICFSDYERFKAHTNYPIILFDLNKCADWCRDFGFDSGSCYYINSIGYAAKCKCESIDLNFENKLYKLVNSTDKSNFKRFKLINIENNSKASIYYWSTTEPLFTSGSTIYFKDAELGSHKSIKLMLKENDSLLVENYLHDDVSFIDSNGSFVMLNNTCSVDMKRRNLNIYTIVCK